IHSICAAAAELIAEERHGDLCCLIANEYIEKRKHCLGSKLIAVHLVIDGDEVELYDGARREITGQYSAYLPQEDRVRYTKSDLVLSAMVDIAPRSIYVYGGESNLKLLRRIQLMFSNVYPVEGKRAMF
ncbi:MAG: sporulation protein YtxC, partial [Clostridia bacterium]